MKFKKKFKKCGVKVRKWIKNLPLLVDLKKISLVIKFLKYQPLLVEELTHCKKRKD